MRKSYIFIVVILFSCGILAQTDKVDSFIKELNNDQLYGTCNYIWVLKMNSKSADSLVNIGKSVSEKLIPLLEDSEKGIIAHCVLSRIWDKNFIIKSSFENFEKKGIVNYEYNGLHFYEKDEKMIADENTLTENKKRWIEKISKYNAN